MRCPHLVKWVLFTCNASAPPYRPSHFHLSEYCLQNTHRRCPLFLGLAGFKETLST